MADKVSAHVKEVIATMEIEGFRIDEGELKTLQQLDNDEVSIDKLIKKIIAECRLGTL